MGRISPFAKVEILLGAKIPGHSQLRIALSIWGQRQAIFVVNVGSFDDSAGTMLVTGFITWPIRGARR